MSCEHKFSHLQFFNFLHALEAFGNVFHIELTLPHLSTSHALSVMAMDSSFSCVLFDQIQLDSIALRICCSRASFVRGHWSIVRFNLENKYFRQSFTGVWGHEASYMRTTKFSIILMSASEGFDTHESLITNRLYEIFLNV